jgi:hypothetical protein
MGEMKNMYNILVRTEGKRPLARRRLRREDNIIMHLRKMVWGDVV